MDYTKKCQIWTQMCRKISYCGYSLFIFAWNEIFAHDLFVRTGSNEACHNWKKLWILLEHINISWDVYSIDSEMDENENAQE